MQYVSPISQSKLFTVKPINLFLTSLDCEVSEQTNLLDIIISRHTGYVFVPTHH